MPFGLFSVFSRSSSSKKSTPSGEPSEQTFEARYGGLRDDAQKLPDSCTGDRELTENTRIVGQVDVGGHTSADNATIFVPGGTKFSPHGTVGAQGMCVFRNGTVKAESPIMLDFLAIDGGTNCIFASLWTKEIEAGSDFTVDGDLHCDRYTGPGRPNVSGACYSPNHARPKFIKSPTNRDRGTVRGSSTPNDSQGFGPGRVILIPKDGRLPPGIYGNGVDISVHGDETTYTFH